MEFILHFLGALIILSVLFGSMYMLIMAAAMGIYYSFKAIINKLKGLM